MKTIHIFTELSPLSKKNRNSELNSQFLLNHSNDTNVFIIPWYKNLKLNEEPVILHTDKQNGFEVYSGKYFLTENTYYLIKPIDSYYPFFNIELNIQNCLIHFFQSGLCFIANNFDKSILHLHGFLLAPLTYLVKSKNLSDRFKTILSLQNLSNDLNFFEEHYIQLFPNSLYLNEIRRNGLFTSIKCGLIFADIVVLKSKHYADEVQNPEYGNEYQSIFMEIKHKLYGIMNGVQYGIWNPLTDQEIYKTYSAENLDQKIENKLFLQNKMHLTQSAKIPMFFFGTRLDEIHGLNLIIDSLEELSKLPIHLIIKGTGDEELILKLEEKILKYQNIKLIKGFNLSQVHEILAACEFILLPGSVEPDGVSFLYALKYGLVPVAHKTGGYRDAVIDMSSCIEDPSLIEDVNGFFFSSYFSTSLIQIIEEAIEVYKDKKLFQKYQKNCMQADWSWKKSIKQYNVLYKKLWADF